MLQIVALRLRCPFRYGLLALSKAKTKMSAGTAVYPLTGWNFSSAAPPAPPSTEIKSDSQSPQPSEAVKPITARDRLRAAVKDYGSTVIVFHVCSGVTFLCMWYLIVSSGMDVSSVIQALGLEGSVGKLAGGASTFVVAYAIHKATAPLRIGLTLTATPLLVNFLRKKGLMKLKAN